MFSYLRKPARATKSRRNVNVASRLKTTWLKLDRLEQREVPATFIVNNLNDGTITGPGQIPGSLRQAIFDANALPGADIIDATSVVGTLSIIAGDFQISDSVAINGPGAKVLTIDAAKNSRHFYVSDDKVSRIDVSMNNMTLTNGLAQTPPNPNPTFLTGSGGSIYVRNERLTLDGMIITNSAAAPNFSGGAISMGDRPIPDQFNGSSGEGSSLYVLNSVIDSNAATGLGGSGGGIYFHFPNSGTPFLNAVGNTFALVNSTISNNTAGKRAGAIYFSAGNDVKSSFSMRNATVSGNKSLFEFAGGVLINSTTGVPISILNSTITNNNAMTTPGGGGLAINQGTGTINIENSVIADNFGSPTAPELFSNTAVTINARNNIIGSKTGLSSATIFNDLGGNVYGSAKLAPLAANGGPTTTHLPGYNSPAINPAGTVTATTLAVAANSGSTGTSADTTLTVASNANLVIGGYIRIESEVMLVTGLTGLTGVTVARGQNGTSPVTHAIGVAVNTGFSAVTTLSAAAAIGASTIAVVNAANLVPGAFIAIDSEYVQINSVSGTTVTLGSTLASAHVIGAGVNSASVNLSTLTPAISGTDTITTVATTIGIVPGMNLLIDSEIIKVTQVSTTAPLATLNAALSSSATLASVASTAGLTVGTNLVIDSENVRLTAITNIATTLAAAITNPNQAFCIVTSATGIVSGMLLLIDAEYVLVTGVSGTTLTITRAQNGTTAVTHANAAAVTSNTITISRGQLSTLAVAHNSGAALVAPTLTILRGQSSTSAAAHTAGRAIMLANDQRGNSRRQGGSIDIGSLEVNPATPAAIATVSNVTVAGGATGTFTITYTSNTAIDVATIKNNNNAIRVIGPNGFDVPATYVSLNDDVNNGSPRVANYSFAAPGTWDYTDNGAYSIVVQSNQVFDTVATAVPSAAVGTFQAAIGRTLVVTDPNDSGVGTLRDAIDQANQNKFVADTITFDTVAMGTTTNFVNSATLMITDPVVINGPGITVDGGNLVRIFRSDGPGNMPISVTGLTIANGMQAVTQTDSGLGSGVLGDDDQWTLTNCTLTGNTGGAIALYSVITWGSLTLVGCKIENNIGGGVVSGTSPFGPGHDISIQNTTINNNKGSGFSGRTFSFNMANSTISNNTGATRGGGINIVGNFNSKGNSIINSTISGNSASNSGAGIYMYWSPTTLGQRVLIANSTIVGNTSNGGFINEPGGGINNRATTDYLVDFENCVIASNTNSTVPDFNSKSKVVANNSLIGIYQPLAGIVAGVNNKLGSKAAPLDPVIGPLANNGGSTETRMPYAGSPLVDASGVVSNLSTLTARLNAFGSTAIVASTSGIAPGMYVGIDSEILRVAAIGTASQTTLTGPMTAVQTNALVATNAPLNVGQNLLVDSEWMQVTQVTAAVLTNLAADLTDIATTVTVASTASLTVGMFLRVDGEYIRVTAINDGTTMTVARAQLQTTATSHSNGATVAPQLTTAMATLGGAITTTSGTTTVTVNDSSNLTVNMNLLIDSEYVRITTITNATTIVVARAQLGTTGATHVVGSTLFAPTINVSRAQQGTTAATHIATSSLIAPTVTFVNNFGTRIPQLGSTSTVHDLGANLSIPYTQPANDQRGVGFPRSLNGKVDIGAVEVDPNIPAAVLTTPIAPIVTSGQSPVTFSVTYTDNVAINVSTVKNNSNVIRVTGPNGFNQLATYISMNDDVNNGTPRVAIYSIDAPGSSWDTFENGFYTLTVESMQVADTGGTFVESHAIGKFQVALTLNLVVTNDNDSGPGSLRDALDLANANQGVADTITFDASFFSTPRTITMTLGELPILDPVTITGPGAKFATLQGFASRIFTIDTFDIQQPVFISGLTMTGGNGQTTINAGVTPGGGAILNVDEALTITNSVITKNDAGPGTTYGGGILLGNALASLNLQNSTLSNNTAGQSGGGLSVRYGCFVTIDGTTITGNTASTNGDGGGISAQLGFSSGQTPTPTITLTNSTVSNNTAGSGGGLRMGNGVSASKFAVLTILNSTFSGNVASTGVGGGIQTGGSIQFTIQNTTITGNYARTGGGGLQLNAAFNSKYGAADGAVINSVIAGNINRISPDIGGGNSTAGFALSFVNSLVGAVDQTQTKINNLGSQIGSLAAPIDPLLSPLTTNGNATQVHMPKPGSTLINAGTTTPTVVLTTLSAAVPDGAATSITVTSVAAILIGTFIQIDSEIMLVTANTSGSTFTVARGQQSTTPAAHALGANLVRPTFLPPTANDQRGAGFPRQIGAIDIGAVEVNPNIPVAAGVFAKITAPTSGVQNLVITFTDDVGMSMASIIGNNNAVRVTGPNGFNTLASFVSATPGTGGKVETATYSFTPPGGGWDNTEDGFYSVSIEPTQISDGTNFVYSGLVNTLQVAIPRNYVVDLTVDDDDGNYTPGNLSIREAIKLANENVGTADVITFSPSVFSTQQIIGLFSGFLTITDPVTITGPGSSLAILDAFTIGRVMFTSMTPAYWGSKVSISGLTLANGSNSPSLAGAASGITNETADLELDNVEITGMYTNGSAGAIGLSSYWAGLKLTNSKIYNNIAFQGAGVYVGNNGSALTTIPNTVQVSIQNTVFDLNSSQTSITGNGGSGAALYVLGGANVSVTDSTFTNNVVGTSGAAIFVNGSTVNILRSNISNNSAVSIAAAGGGQGGGVFVATPTTATSPTIVTIQDSTIAGNAAGNISGVATGAGGGIFVQTGAILNLEGSTVSGNAGNTTTTTSGGGGVYLTGTAQVTITNSTISGNTTKSLGAGIMLNSLTSSTTSTAGFLVVRNSTVAFNNATGAASTGGGIAWRTTTGTGTPTVSITSSIVADNLATVGNPNLKSGTPTLTFNQSFAFNNSLSNDSTSFTFAGANNKFGLSGLDSNLALNGAPVGSPLTHALLAGSQAIDSGANATPVSFDQRGTSFSRTVNNATDMGAFEVQNGQPLPTVTTIKVNDGSSNQRSMVTSMTITFSEAVTFPNGISSAFSLVRTQAFSGAPLGSVNVTGTQLGNVVTLTFLNGGAVTLDPGGSLPDGKYSLTLISNQIAGVGGFLDGNMNGTYQGVPTDNVVSTPFHRLFGDGDGNGTVNSFDFAMFRSVFGLAGPSIFDYNADNQTNNLDFAQFRARFGLTI